MESSDKHSKNQQEFWMALINKYEKRNLMLEQQILSLQKQIEHPDRSSREPLLAKKDSTCSCSPCTAQKPDNEGDKISSFSLSSTDLKCISQLRDLVDHEKLAKQKLSRLQQQTFISKAEVFKGCRCSEISAINNTLLAENNRLTNELKDLRLEMKRCIEKIKGPITREIEKERSKNKCLENEIERICKSTEDMKQNFASETKDLKSKLSKIHQELSLISAVNSKLEEELVTQNCKCRELEEALTKQMEAEAGIYKTLKAAHMDSKQKQSTPPCTPCAPHQSIPMSPHGDTKKRFSLTPDEYKRFPCYQQPTKPNDIKQVSKSTISEKPAFESCKCQTQKEITDSTKVQAKPELSETSASAVAGKVDIKSSTDKNTVEQTIATDENKMEDTAAETTLKTTEDEDEIDATTEGLENVVETES